MDLNTWKQHRLARVNSRSGDLTVAAIDDAKPDSFDQLLNSDGGCRGALDNPTDESNDFAFWDLISEGGFARCR
jgi:hypothetical protein